MAANRDEERVFGYYLELPHEIRIMIINNMQPDTRCRFIRCSHLSNREAKSSKHFIQSLAFRFMSSSHIRIEVFHHIQQNANEKTLGYVLKFVEESRHNKYCAQIGLDRQELWKVALPTNIDLIQHVKEYYLKMLQSYKDQIKSVTIRGSPNVLFKNLDDRITSLRRLEELDVDETVDMVRFLPIVYNNREPIKDLRIDGERINRILGDFQATYQVQNSIILKHLGLNMRNFRKMAAKNIRIHIGKLTERNVFNIICKWHHGTLGKTIESYQWILANSDFSLQTLLELLREDENSFANGHKIEIQNHDRSASAAIGWSRLDNCLEFNVEHED